MKDKVREKVIFIVNVELLFQLVFNFKVGCVKEYIINWKVVIIDFVIFDVIQYYYIEFEGYCRFVQVI